MVIIVIVFKLTYELKNHVLKIKKNICIVTVAIRILRSIAMVSIIPGLLLDDENNGNFQLNIWSGISIDVKRGRCEYNFSRIDQNPYKFWRWKNIEMKQVDHDHIISVGSSSMFMTTEQVKGHLIQQLLSQNLIASLMKKIFQIITENNKAWIFEARQSSAIKTGTIWGLRAFKGIFYKIKKLK